MLLQDANGAGIQVTGSSAGDAALAVGALPVPVAPLQPPFLALPNLLPVTRGKTVANEVLGSGNAAVAGQDFMLRKSPVTYFMDPASLSGDGFNSTVRVWVNQVQWSEVPSFFGQPPNATVFATREDEQGNTHVTFGDGINGSCLPSGVNNVIAAYRFGSGAEAPAPGTLTNILQPQPGLKSLRNPVAPTGGSDPDPPSRVRTLAPRSVLTFGRAISLDDYQVIAAATPGVIQAEAAYHFDPVSQRPCVTVWVSGDAGAVAAVRTAIAGEADPNRPVLVLPATGIETVVRLVYVRDARYLDDALNSALHTALLDPDSGLFGVNAVGIGQAFYDSQIYAACLAVPGVVAIEDLSVRTRNGMRQPFQALGLRHGRTLPLRRGRMPGNVAPPCTGQRHDPGTGNYLSVPDDGMHLRLTGRVAS
jgi:predicted phage baseplate assembly protein